MCLKLAAVGDISFGDFPFCSGYGIRSSLEKNKNFNPFSDVTEYFNTCDIVFGNLETVLSDIGLNSNDLQSWEMRGSPESVQFLKNAGFNVLNLANNHSMQHGESAFIDTCQLLEDYGIEVVGRNSVSGGGCKPVIYDNGKVRVGILGYAFEQDLYSDAICYAYGPTCNIQSDISELKKNVDFVLVSCHWGLEFIDTPSINTITLAHKIVDWGADLILGHHPHCLHGVEEYNDSLIIYSMGNFLFDMMWNVNYVTSAIYILKLDKPKILLEKIIPVKITNKYETYKVDTNDSSASIKHIEQLNIKLKTAIKSFYNGDIEKQSIRYYKQYGRLQQKNRYQSYIYFLKNLTNCNMNMTLKIISRSLMRRIGRE